MRPLTEEEKKRIADLYNNTRMSIGAIAEFLNYSTRTIQRYKNYK